MPSLGHVKHPAKKRKESDGMTTKVITTIMMTLFLASMMAITIPTRADGTVIVANLGDDGWIMGDTRYNGIVEFVVGPDNPPAGIGSLRLATTNNNPDKAGVAKHGDFGSIPSISGSYCWYRTSSTNGFQAPAFKLGVDTDGDGSVDIIVVYEPYFQDGFDPSTSDFVWIPESFDTSNGKWWLWVVGVGSVGQSYAGVKTLSGWLADGEYGSELSGGNIVALLFEVGSWNANTDGYVDKFDLLGLGYITDFEPYGPLWVKASGGGEFYDDYPDFTGHHCTIGLIGMSLSAVTQGTTTDYKGSGVFVDHDLKFIVNLDVTSGRLTLTGKKEAQFWGTARVKDIEGHDKWTGTFWIGLVDDAYGVTNRFALHLWRDSVGKFGVWHGTLLEGSEVTVWFWE
ncbi:MAG: hypothetical protein OEY40_00360 [Candidatus Bathyarchaeota archaeon]|nr:hypothetical protein [Candidatus Bathyarchaeota archaeon]